MKSKLVILSLLLSGTATLATAQEKGKFYTEKAKDNWFISVGVGAQASTNPDSDFGKTVTPLINLSVGKYISPIWGIRGQVYGWESKQTTAYPFAAFAGQKAVERKESYIGLNADAMLNLSNLFCGYKEGRKFEFTLFAGPSLNVAKNYGTWQLGYTDLNLNGNFGETVTGETKIDPNKCKAVHHELRWLVGASVGLGAKYNVNDKWAIDLEVRGQVTPSILGAYSSASTDGYLYASIGATYTFGGKKFTKVAEAKQVTTQEVVKEIVKEVPVEVVKEVVKEVPTAAAAAIFFKIGKSAISEEGMVNVKLMAKTMKANPGMKYKVAGFADKATGTEALNQTLSEKRAQAVYDALIAEGVNANQLEKVAMGGTEPMFNGNHYLNRVVILEVK